MLNACKVLKRCHKNRAENFNQTINVLSKVSIKWLYYEQRVGIFFANIVLLLETVFMFDRLTFCLSRSKMYSVRKDPTPHLFFFFAKLAISTT